MSAKSPSHSSIHRVPWHVLNVSPWGSYEAHGVSRVTLRRWWLEGYLSCKLDYAASVGASARAVAEAAGKLEPRGVCGIVVGDEDLGSGDSSHAVLIGEDAGYIAVVEDVEGLCDQLEVHRLPCADGLGKTWIERIEVGKTIQIAGRSRRALASRVLAAVQRAVERRRVGLARLRRTDGADLPSAGDLAGDAVEAASIGIEIPDRAGDEAVAYIVVAWGEIDARAERIVVQLRI